MEPDTEYFAAFAVSWIALGIGGTWLISRISDPARKRYLLRTFAVGTALVFAAFVWLMSRSLETMLSLLGPLALIVFLNIRLVKVCDKCAGINRPQGLSAPAHCHKCGAELPR